MRSPHSFDSAPRQDPFSGTIFVFRSSGELVVVGDLIGAGSAQERGVVGETPNLAARLQALVNRARSSLSTAPQ